jgi:hypothetical protein
MKLNGLPQERRRASNNRSLLISLEQDSNTSGISGERIHRRSKHTLSSIPNAERAELPDDIEFSERPSGVLSALHVGIRLRQVGDEVDVVSLAILPFRHADGEHSSSHFDGAYPIQQSCYARRRPLEA